MASVPDSATVRQPSERIAYQAIQESARASVKKRIAANTTFEEPPSSLTASTSRFTAGIPRTPAASVPTAHSSGRVRMIAAGAASLAEPVTAITLSTVSTAVITLYP